jgi:DNA repair protein RadC
MTIKSWPEEQRPREKLLLRGAHALSDAELLAVILRTGSPGKSAVELGQALINHCGGMHELLGATPMQLSQVKGVGQAKRTQIQAMLELARRSLAATIQKRDLLTSTTQVKDFLRSLLIHKNQEAFLCLFLDTQNHLIIAEELFRGSLTETAVYPREVARQALHHNAASLIVAHNHPSGLAEPSQADADLTAELHHSMELIDVRLLDHLIVAGQQVFSFAEAGMLRS